MVQEQVLINKIRAHAKIIRDLHLVEAALGTIIEGTADRVTHQRNEAAFTTAVLVYARSFTTVRSGIVYPVKTLRNHPDFDRSIHDHLIEMRNKVVAHADEESFPADISFTCAGVETDINRIFIAVVNVAVHCFEGFSDPEFFRLLVAHVRACEAEARSQFKTDCLALMTLMNTPERTIARAHSTDLVDVGQPAALGGGVESVEISDLIDLNLTQHPTIPMGDKYKFSHQLFLRGLEQVSFVDSNGEEIVLGFEPIMSLD